MTQQTSMQTISKTFPHRLDLEDAKAVAETAFEFYRDRDVAEGTGIAPTFAWRGAPPDGVADITLTMPPHAAPGQQKVLHGTLTITPGQIELKLGVPHEFRLMAPLALELVAAEVQKWLV